MTTGGAASVQDIRFARSADGVGIAYAVHGSGPPLLIVKNWLSHLQFDWQSPVWRLPALHNAGCRRGLKPPASNRHLAM